MSQILLLEERLQETSFALSFDVVELYTDLNCSEQPELSILISSVGSVQLPWAPPCSDAYCDSGEAFVGSRFDAAQEAAGNPSPFWEQDEASKTLEDSWL
eukprot:3596914-Amphidinium_carterae.1